MSATSVERVSSPNQFAELQLPGIKPLYKGFDTKSSTSPLQLNVNTRRRKSVIQQTSEKHGVHIEWLCKFQRNFEIDIYEVSNIFPFFT